MIDELDVAAACWAGSKALEALAKTLERESHFAEAKVTRFHAETLATLYRDGALPAEP